MSVEVSLRKPARTDRWSALSASIRWDRALATTLQRVWKSFKQTRLLPLGPVSIAYAARRTVPVRPGVRHDVLEAPSTPRTEFDELADPGSILSKDIALIVGVGPGLGEALARRLARAGLTIVLATRNARRLDSLLTELRAQGSDVFSYGCDATNEGAVKKLLSDVDKDIGTPKLVVYSLQWSARNSGVDIEGSAFEEAWRHNCFGPFLVAREAARLMIQQAKGSIVLIGSTSSLIGRAQHLSLAVGKFGTRALAQVLSRELWPQGVHVAHLVVDADIMEDGQASGVPQSDPGDIADMVLMLHRQPRSAWTSELDLRPWNEEFWEHC